MMKFLKLYVVILILCFTLAMFGGLALFDFDEHWFLAIASRAFLITAVVAAFWAQEERIEQLEQKISELEDKKEISPDK